MIDYSLILSTNYANKQWSLIGDSYDGLDWLDPSPKPTQAQLDDLWIPTQEMVAKNACKQKAVQILNETDWTSIPDVANPSDSNPYLLNQSEFFAYRSQVRQLAINPVTDPVFPTQPTPLWGNK